MAPFRGSGYELILLRDYMVISPQLNKSSDPVRCQEERTVVWGKGGSGLSSSFASRSLGNTFSAPLGVVAS